MTVEPNNQDRRLTPVKVDEALVEPARRGLRKFGTGLGAFASGGIMTVGVGSGAFGGLLMSMTTGFFYGLGAFFLAGGMTAIGLGAISLFALRKADAKADVREVERRLLKLIHADGTVSDAEAARRIGVDVTVIRATADRLVRSGVLDVDVDPNTGADVYTLESPILLETDVSSAEQAEMQGFDEKLALAQEPAQQSVRQSAEVEVS
ncbi:MAG: hypothetical protein ACJAYU_004011 [Bradymonadia bacterium]|jgi:hypothetical protein